MRRFTAVAAGMALLLSACAGAAGQADIQESASEPQSAGKARLIQETSKENARTLIRAAFDPAGESDLSDADIDGLMGTMCDTAKTAQTKGQSIEEVMNLMGEQVEDDSGKALQRVAMLSAISSTCPDLREWAGDYLLTGPQTR